MLVWRLFLLPACRDVLAAFLLLFGVLTSMLASATLFEAYDRTCATSLLQGLWCAVMNCVVGRDVAVVVIYSNT